MTTSESFSSTAAVIRRVLHASDFSEASLVAFAHALKAALISKSELVLIHISDEDQRERTEFPGVRETLERWKLLPLGSPRSAVAELGIDVAKIIGRGSDPVEGVLEFIEQHGADLIVLSTHHHGLDWLHQSVSEPVARKSGEMTLFVPAGAPGFVSLADGLVSLGNILIPIAATPQPQAAIAGAVRLTQQLKCESGKFILLHVGENGPLPAIVTSAWRAVSRITSMTSPCFVILCHVHPGHCAGATASASCDTLRVPYSRFPRRLIRPRS